MGIFPDLHSQIPAISESLDRLHLIFPCDPNQTVQSFNKAAVEASTEHDGLRLDRGAATSQALGWPLPI